MTTQNSMAEALRVAILKGAGIAEMEAAARAGGTASIKATELTQTGGAATAESAATAGTEVVAGVWTEREAWIVNTKDLEAGAGVLTERTCMNMATVTVGVHQEIMAGGVVPILNTRRK